jgi:hypothetical protein
LPSADGTAGQALITNGLGILSWASGSSVWVRAGTTLSPSVAGDDITSFGDIYTSGSGTIVSAGLLTGNAGANILGGVINLNSSSNYATNINSGTSIGTITLGNSLAGAISITSGNGITLVGGAASSFSTSSGALTVTSAAATTWGTSSGNLTLQAAGTGTTANIQIGAGGAGSTTPDLFALDVKSTTGDPASGADGAMYYNGFNDKFRCYINGSWMDCAHADLDTIYAATSTNTINNGDNAQVWNWSLTTADKAAFTFGENIASTASGKAAILEAKTLASSTAIPLYVSNYGEGVSFRVDDEPGDVTQFLIDKYGNTGIGTNYFDPTNPEKLKVEAGTTTSFNVISGYGDLNSYLQLNIRNRNAGNLASSDLVATADNGNENSHYIDVGINSSGYNNAAYSITGPNDGYLYVMGNSGAGNLAIGTASANTVIKFHTGGTTATNERMRIDNNGNVGIGTISPGSKLDIKGTFRLSGATSGYVGLQAAAAAGSTTYTLPSADGTAGYALATNGSGTLYWANAIPPFQRVGTTISPVNSGDDVTTSGNIYTSGSGAITSAGFITGNLGLNVSGATINLNNNSNYSTNINTGSSTGTIDIGSSLAGTINITSGSSITLTGSSASTWSTTSGALTITSAAAAAWGTSAGNLNLQVAGAGASANVQIGSGVGSTTPDLFALDVKSTTGDPVSGADGAMYYNEFSNKFRCHVNGSWVDCDTTGGTVSMQTAYNNGASIVTAESVPITFTLTSGNFDVTGTNAVNLAPTAASQFTSGGALTLTGGAASTWSTTSGALTITSAAAATWGTTVGDLTLQSAGIGTSANIHIGAGGAGSTTPDLFALDVKSTTGDPAGGYNGAMYYNQADGVFRCYEAGGWKNCGQSAATATTLQQAYTAGHAISTTGNDITFALNNTDKFTASGDGSVDITPTGASSFTSGGALTLTGGAASTWSTTSGALTITSAAAAAWGTSAGNLNLQVAGAGASANVQIGSGVGSTTPDVLVLDLKSNSGDPTGTNGAMYYNSNSNKMRCYENGAWKDCDVSSITTLQQAYENGNSIITSSSNPISFTLTSGDFNVTGTGAINLTPTSSSQFTSGGALTLTGGATSTWGTSAGNLKLQAAGADTANIQIGSGVGSTTPDMLVLDIKSNSGDPTGTNGAMYYNSSSSKMRCYENGAWKNCDAGIPQATGLAKGDLIAYTASNTPTRLPVGGTTGWVLTVDPTQTTGMKWAAAPSAPVTTVFGRTGDILAVTNDYTWAQIDKTTSSLADITTRSAGDLNTGTLSDSRLSSTVTKQGNTFNSADELVMLDSSTKLPVADGSQLTGLTKVQVGLGNVENITLSTWTGSTNITTLGTIGTGTWSATTISAAKGGTGISSYAAGDVLYASATNTLSKLPIGSEGQVLTINSGMPSWQNIGTMTNPMTNLGDIVYGGTGGTPTRLAGSAGFLKSTGSSAPTWSSVSLTNDVTGVLPIANGGTNSITTPTSGGVSYGTGSAYAFTDAGSSGQVLKSNGAATPTWVNGGTMMLSGNSNNNSVNNRTLYFPISGISAGSTTSSQAGTRNLMSRAGTVRNLYVITSAALPSGKTGSVTVTKNGVDTSLALTLDTVNTSFNNITDSFTVSAGDEIGIKVTTTGNVLFSWAADFTY